MELRKFVTSALADIALGIADAQRTEGVGGLIAPSGVGGHEFPEKSGVLNSQRIISTAEQFDLAVTSESTDQTSSSATGGIVVLNAQMTGSTQVRNETVSRLKFSVPLVMPENPRQWHTEKGTQ